MSTQATRVLVVDDDAFVRAGLRMLLDEHDDLEIVGEASDGQEAIDMASDLAPDIVLMDIRMPRLDGLSATQALMGRSDPPRVIVLTTFEADAHVLDALHAGADGFLLKDTDPADIVTAVRRAAEGDPALSPSVARTLIERFRGGDSTTRTDDARRRLETLTERERDVALAVGRGLSNAEIAKDLHLSVATVKGYISALFMKLEVTNRVQIAICTHDAGLG